jgi:hypothetical protein
MRLSKDAGDAEPLGELDAVHGMSDVLASLFGLGRDEVLVNREHRQGERVAEGGALQVVDVGGGLVGHLAVQDLDAVKAEARGVFDHFLNRVFRAAKVPVGVSRHGQADAPSGRAGSRRRKVGGRERCRGALEDLSS